MSQNAREYFKSHIIRTGNAYESQVVTDYYEGLGLRAPSLSDDDIREKFPYISLPYYDSTETATLRGITAGLAFDPVYNYCEIVDFQDWYQEIFEGDLGPEFECDGFSGLFA
jgi:hypothetical protein